MACWGNNDKGQLGLGDTSDRGKAPDELAARSLHVDIGDPPVGGPSDKYPLAATGGAHTCVVVRFYGSSAASPVQKFKCWGDNSRGQLGLGDTDNRGDEPGEMGNALPSLPSPASYVPDFPPVDAPFLALGALHSCVLSASYGTGSPTWGRITCWGANDAGQLGAGDSIDRGTTPGQSFAVVDLGTGLMVPEAGSARHSYAIGSDHGCARVADATGPLGVKCWGKNDKGQLGLGDTNHRGDSPGEMGDALPFVDLR